MFYYITIIKTLLSNMARINTLELCVGLYNKFKIFVCVAVNFHIIFNINININCKCVCTRWQCATIRDGTIQYSNTYHT
jgi:hypothetical protein